MRILLTGANGFIGRQLLAGLLARGHTVVAAVRDPATLRWKWPDIETIAVDFNCDTSVDTWRKRIAGVDAVINCVGVLHGNRQQHIDAIHTGAPIALFDACEREAVRKVVQISAISANADAGTVYALTKKRADDYLRTLNVDWTVLRPSLVYGEGSYGGTSTIRGLAGLPFFTPVIGDDSTAFRPLHVADLVETVVRVIETGRFARRTLEPVGSEIITLHDLIAKYRRWLGLAPALPIAVPLPIVRAIAQLVDLAGGGPMGSAALRQLMAGNVGCEAPGVFEQAIGFRPTPMDERLAERPAQTQDLWHARLYFLRPMLRLALAVTWLGSAIVGVLAPAETYASVATALAKIGAPPRLLAIGGCALDVAIAVALLWHLRPRLLAVVQLVVVLGYTLGLSILVPSLWLDPFGTLLKNLPILVAIAVWAVLEEER